MDVELPGDEDLGIDGGDGELIEEGPSNEDLAASIDGALALADENGEGEKEVKPEDEEEKDSHVKTLPQPPKLPQEQQRPQHVEPPLKK